MTTLIATIGPLDVGAVFAALSANYKKEVKKKIAFKATVVSMITLVFFALVGNILLTYLSISLAALKTSGGVLLFLIGLDLIFARHSGGVGTTDEEIEEASHKKDIEDIAVFPLATPLIAGPGSIGAIIILMSEQSGNLLNQSIIVVCLVVVVLMTYWCMLLADRVQKILGITGINVVSRMIGFILTGLAVQFVFDGIRESGLI